jgi:hypothetical protein
MATLLGQLSGRPDIAAFQGFGLKGSAALRTLWFSGQTPANLSLFDKGSGNRVVRLSLLPFLAAPTGRPTNSGAFNDEDRRGIHNPVTAAGRRPASAGPDPRGPRGTASASARRGRSTANQGRPGGQDPRRRAATADLSPWKCDSPRSVFTMDRDARPLAQHTTPTGPAIPSLIGPVVRRTPKPRPATPSPRRHA